MIKFPFAGKATPSGLASVTLIIAALLCWGDSLWIASKAVVAQVLIKDAWEETLATGATHKPWAWADTWPVAAIAFPSQNEELYALAGSHGTSLAFGPGHLDGTALPGEPGTKVFSAHRDTHFRFLEQVAIGEIFKIQQKDGRWQHYRVADTRIVDTYRDPWVIDPDSDEVQLVTCYPFNSMALNPTQRYIVTGMPVPAASERGRIVARLRM